VQIYKDLTILYHTSLRLYYLASGIAGLFSNKAALFYNGRKGLLNYIKQRMSLKDDLSGTRYWIHCASVGEFEQARPLIEKIKEIEPSSYIVVTFFSPSGYELRKNYSLAANVFYLPMDTIANARKFVEYVKPDVAIFIKYEFWRNYLSVLKQQNIPVYLVSAIFRENQPFFRWWGANFRKMLGNFTHFFVQDDQSETLLRSIGITNVSVAGDTRFDRVIEITRNNKTIAPLELFTENIKVNDLSLEKPGEKVNELLIKYLNSHICCVAGSTWPPDEELLRSFMKNYELTKIEKSNDSKVKPTVLKLIIAPHEVEEAHIKKIESLFAEYKVVKFSDFLVKQDETMAQPNKASAQQNKASALQNRLFIEQNYTQAQIEKLTEAQVFIIDTVGILSTAYRYGNFAYVGGGFGVGIHNILEAATYGLPVVFGPKYEKFKEAKDLIPLGGAFSVEKDQTEILEKLVWDHDFREKCSKVCEHYVQKNIGATAIILKQLLS